MSPDMMTIRPRHIAIRMLGLLVDHEWSRGAPPVSCPEAGPSREHQVNFEIFVKKPELFPLRNFDLIIDIRVDRAQAELSHGWQNYVPLCRLIVLLYTSVIFGECII